MHLVTTWLKINRALGAAVGITVLLCALAFNAGTSATDSKLLPGPKLPTVPTQFKIHTLTANNISAIEAAGQMCDDRAGIAVSTSKVFLVGDNSAGCSGPGPDAGIWNRNDLSSPSNVGASRDGIVMDLHSEAIYTLADSSGNPINCSDVNNGVTVAKLIQLDPDTGALTNTVIDLSSSISITRSSEEAGVFSGYDRIVLVDGSNAGAEPAYNIDLPSGTVTNVGTITSSAYKTRTKAECWATWGVAEYFSGAIYIAYVANFTQVDRTNVSTNATSVVTDFSPKNLSDEHEFTVLPSLKRWYFHYEGGNSSSIAGNRDETLGFADATFDITGQCTSAPDGMVSWWKGEGNADDSQDDNNGIFNGTPAYASGKVSQAFSFDGNTANYVSVPPNANLDLAQFTVDAWIYPTTDSGVAFIIDKSFPGDLSNYYLALTSDHHLEADFDAPSIGHQSVGSIATVPTNEWTHVAATYDGTTLKLYINGTLDNFEAFGSTPATDSQPVFIGKRSNDTFAFTGLIDEVEVFSHPLTDADVAGIFIAGSNGKCPCTPAPPDLVSWWRAEGDAIDTQDGNHGTLVNGATFAAGEVGQGFSLNGTNQYVEIPSSPNLEITGAISVDAWIKPDDFSSYPQIITKYNNDDTNQRSWSMGIQPTGQIAWGVQNGSNYRYVDTPSPIPTGVWTHVAGTFNPTTQEVKIYVNGVDTNAQLESGSVVINSIAVGPDTPVEIGSFFNNPGGQYYFKGVIDEVEIFNRELSANEVAAIYAAGGAGKCRSCTSAPGGMISWWKAENNATDSEDNNNGTFQGTPAYSSGEVGQAFSFGGGSYVSVPDAPNLHFTSAFTLDAWIYPTDLSANPVICSKIHGPGTVAYEFDVSVDGRLVLFISSDGTTNESRYTAAGVISTNHWQHVAVTFDNGSVQFFVNGSLSASDTFSSSSVFPGTDALFIGSNGSGANFTGLIDELEAFGRPLTENEIRKIYDAGSKGKCPCTVPPTGMVSWWPGDLNPFDYQDHNHGTLVGGYGYATGEVGEAFSFDGSTGYVTIPHNDNQSIQTAITIDAWIMKKGSCTNNCIVVMKQTGDNACCDNLRYGLIVGGGFGVAAGVVDFAFNTGSWEDVVLSNTIIQDNVWYHIAGTYDSTTSTASIYVNGVLDNSVTKTGLILPSTSGNLYIGRDSTPNSEFFNGLIDETELFNTALSADQIKAIYDAGGAGKCKPQGTPTPTPTPTSTPTPTPAASPREADGHGTILSPVDGQASFGFNIHLVKTKKKTKTVASFSYSDPAAGLAFGMNKLTSLSLTSNNVHFTGTAKLSNKTKISFTVDANDSHSSLTPDTFSIEVSNGYSASGPLLSGGIAIQ